MHLTEELLHEAAQLLAGRDPHLAAVLERLGPPPLWAREPGFATLVFIILEQQVSLASARAAYGRLSAALMPISPAGLLTLSDEDLRAIGFSRQKTRYTRGLARAILEDELNLDALPGLDESAVHAALTRLKGIGPWTADIYLMEALLRPDIWPTADLALKAAVRSVKGLPSIPTSQELETIGQLYRPWRSVAARMFWYHYLNAPNQNQVGFPDRFHLSNI
jgi:DNA-3-methyladenine glycosylase II